MKKLIKKQRTRPLLLDSIEALQRRLPYEEDMLLKKHRDLQAGLGGEEQLDRVFENYLFPMNYHVFNGIQLTAGAHFQIDTLFITPHYAIIFEVKNISGKIKIKDHPPQMIRTSPDGTESAFNSPTVQVKRNCELFQDWLQARQLKLPVYGAVVFAYVKQRVEAESVKIPILFPDAVPSYIRSLPVMTTPLLENEFLGLSEALSKNDQTYIPQPICAMYPSLKEKIINGVQCPHCNHLPMKKSRSGWLCPSCHGKSPDAHKQAIRDWYLLFGGKLSNKECREFLRVTHPQTAYRLLQSMGLKTEGANRNRRYMMDFRLNK